MKINMAGVLLLINKKKRRAVRVPARPVRVRVRHVARVQQERQGRVRAEVLDGLRGVCSLSDVAQPARSQIAAPPRQ